MTPRSLFNIILKIIGIFFIQDFLSSIPQIFSIPLYFRETTTSSEAVWLLINAALSMGIYGFIAYVLIFKSDLVIRKLKLEEGFDQEMIGINVHRSTVLSIAIIVIAGLILANEIPNFCRQLFSHYMDSTAFARANPKTISFVVLSASKIIIGMVLIGNQRQIVNLIERQRKSNSSIIQ